MKTYITLLLALMLQSCSILKKHEQTLRKLNHKEQMQLVEQRTTERQQSELLIIDSSNTDFTMLLWPKGKFTFSVAKGFEGEAEKILIKGNHTNQKIVNHKQDRRNDSSLLKLKYTNEKETSRMVKKNKFSIGYSWAWILIIPAFYVIYRLYKRF